MNIDFLLEGEPEEELLAGFLKSSRSLVFEEYADIEQIEGRPAVYSHASVQRKSVSLGQMRAPLNAFESLSAVRRSAKNFSEKSISIGDLASCVLSSCGITATPNPIKEYFLLANPSAGNLVGTSIWVASRSVEGLDSGIYFFDRGNSSLNFIDTEFQSVYNTLIQPELRSAAAIVCIVGSFDRSIGKYGLRGARYIFLESGHIAQNLCMSATSRGLAACSIGGFIEDNLNESLQLDGILHSAIYCVALGSNIENE